MGEKKLHSFFGFQVEVDKAATRGWYAQSSGWACDCGHCRNFLTLARTRELPATVLEKLDKLAYLTVRCRDIRFEDNIMTFQENPL